MARIHRPGGALTDMEEPQELMGETVLPGFRCRVADLFPQAEGTQPENGLGNGAPRPPCENSVNLAEQAGFAGPRHGSDDFSSGVRSLGPGQ